MCVSFILCAAPDFVLPLFSHDAYKKKRKNKIKNFDIFLSLLVQVFFGLGEIFGFSKNFSSKFCKKSLRNRKWIWILKLPIPEFWNSKKFFPRQFYPWISLAEFWECLRKLPTFTLLCLLLPCLPQRVPCLILPPTKEKYVYK